VRIVAFVSYFLFLGAAICFYLFDRKKIRFITKESPYAIRYVLVFAFLLRVALAPAIKGYAADVGLFRFWSQKAAENLFGIYQGDFFLDYPPFYLYVLFFIGKLAGFMGLTGSDPLYTLLLKLPAIIADIVTGYLLYSVARKHFAGIWPTIIAVIYVFNPAIILDSAIWGQVDSFLVMFLAFGYLLMDSKQPALAGLPLAAAILTKPQGLYFLPIIFYELLKRKDWKLLLRTAALGIFSCIVIILPFALRMGPAWIFKLYFNTAEGYQYATLNAFNLFGLAGANLKPDSEIFLIFSYKAWGFFFIFALLAYTAILYWKGKGRQLSYITALILSLGMFVLSVRMHERYMFPVLFFLLMAVILTRDKWSLIFFGTASFTVFVNTFVVLNGAMNDHPHVNPDDPVLLLISFINLLLFLAIAVWSWRTLIMGKSEPLNIKAPANIIHGGPLWISSESSRFSRPGRLDEEYKPLKVSKTDIILMAVMTIIYMGIALINLGGFEVPDTEWAGETKGEGFIIDLGGEQQVSRLTFYSGLGEGIYNAWYLDAEEEYQPLSDINVDDFYKWHVLEVSRLTSRIKVTVKEPGGMLKEIGVFREGEADPLPVEIRNLNDTPAQGALLHLADEQHLAKYRDDYMTSTYFDEIYHPRTAYEHLNRIKPYEWTHPPLGKVLISIGISLFGMNTFGWRIVGMLVGAAMIPLMYLFGKKLFQKSFYGFCAAFLMMFDLMHFAQTRIGTIDSYTTLFVMLMYYYMADYYLQKSYRKGFFQSLKPLLLSGLFFGLGAASKWSALYGAPGLAVIFFMAKYNEYQDYKEAKSLHANGENGKAPAWVESFIPLYMRGTILYCILFFIIIPAGIYLLSYIPYLMVPGMKPSDILQYQKSMYHYHSTLESEHAFQSPWWSWPFMIRPIWYYKGNDLPEGMASTIVSFGNPAVWWPAIPAFFAAARAAWKRNKAMILIVIAVISLYLPWAVISRSAFIYHFFPMVPFMMLAVVHAIKWFMERGISKYYVYGYLGLVLAMFVLFYPAVSGLVVPSAYINWLRWFPSWVF
jgi:dolichyl-phosphate-mannose-protein mannosyltransferase